MRAGDASSTAKVIAASTILLASDPNTSDLVPAGAASLCKTFLSGNWKDRLLARSSEVALTRALWRALEQITYPGIMKHYWHRKHWIERHCRAAISKGHERLIVIGAGFDTLALRLLPEFKHVKFIEIDHPATQAVKRTTLTGRVSELDNFEFLALDLSNEELPQSILLDPKPTIVVIEGVLMYLTPSEVDRLLDKLRQLSAERLSVIFSFMTRWPDGGTGFRPQSWLIERWMAWRGEPFRWAIEPDAVNQFLAEHDFKQVEVALTPQLAESAATNKLPSLEGENLVLCHRLNS